VDQDGKSVRHGRRCINQTLYARIANKGKDKEIEEEVKRADEKTSNGND